MSIAPELSQIASSSDQEAKLSHEQKDVAAVQSDSQGNSLKREGLKAFITTGVAILLTPLTVSLTFFFTASLQSPKPSIEETSVAVKYEAVPVDAATRSSLSKNPTTAAHLRDAILARTQDNDIDCVSWMKDFQWWHECAQRVRSSLEQISDEAKSALEGPAWMSPQEAANKIRADIHGIEIIEKGINTAEDAPATPRRGEFDVTVGVYNAGGRMVLLRTMLPFISRTNR
jgi:hypothetical protein